MLLALAIEGARYELPRLIALVARRARQPHRLLGLLALELLAPLVALGLVVLVAEGAGLVEL